MISIKEGKYQHPFGTLEVRRSERYFTLSLIPTEPVGNFAAFEWFFNLDGSFDGTGTALAEPAAEEE